MASLTVKIQVEEDEIDSGDRYALEDIITDKLRELGYTPNSVSVRDY